MEKLFKKLREEKGFTLVEMSIVLMVIAVLLVVIIPNISGVSKSVDGTSKEAIEHTIETQKVIYRMDKNMIATEPVSVETLFGDKYITEDQRDAYMDYTNANLDE